MRWQEGEKPALGVSSALAWLHGTAGRGQVCVCQGSLHTHSALYPSWQVPPVLCCVCVHTTVCECLVLPPPFESKGQRDLHYFKEHLTYTSELLTRWVPFKPPDRCECFLQRHTDFPWFSQSAHLLSLHFCPAQYCSTSWHTTEDLWLQNPDRFLVHSKMVIQVKQQFPDRKVAQ